MKRQIVLNSSFVCSVTTPLLVGDINAYEIICSLGASMSDVTLKIIAKRADEVIITDSCRTNNKGELIYTLKNNMHAIPGMLEVAFQICEDDSVLTYKFLRFNVVK